ncbi:putative plant lipid transfer protein/Par allergen [Rosa chinensis]|uniref:Non-specific lipid-transfer protein n=1 Tax=Rosa chinensis TaxID=74649 RepID=A0A2P6R8E5_ROSCH|nr:non-specific lipid-transfer protein 3 [Rosa chinensis]PRQ42705.1 putative plant lipid transfer protein/Par allergen [Rosa chinensis]
MAFSRVLKVICLVVLSVAALWFGDAKAAITCGQVVNKLMPCVAYVQNGGTPAVGCCSGIKTLYGMAQTTPDRQSVCNCLKQAVAGIPYTGANAGLAAGLPGKCGVNLPYKINPSTDCKSIK